MPSAAKPTLEIELSHERDTKKMVRFSEEQDKTARAEQESIHKFYLSKTRWEKLGSPRTIHMRIEPGTESE